MSEKEDDNSKSPEYVDDLSSKLDFKYVVIKMRQNKQATRYCVARRVLGQEDTFSIICQCDHEEVAKRLMNAIAEYDDARKHG